MYTRNIERKLCIKSETNEKGKIRELMKDRTGFLNYYE